MTTAWNHLPNAANIDRVIASVKAHPEAWVAAVYVARTAAWDAARTAAWDAAWDAARAAARAAVWDAVWDAAIDAAGYAAGYAVLALVAWDHSAKFLDMNSNELKMWWVLSEDPAALLLLPAVHAFEKINELEFA